MSAAQRPLVLSPDGDNHQERLLRRVAEHEGGYVAEDRSEASTLANVFKRGWLDRERLAGRWVYTIRAEQFDDAQQELIV